LTVAVAEAVAVAELDAPFAPVSFAAAAGGVEVPL
jgi:hypothetical protein